MFEDFRGRSIRAFFTFVVIFCFLGVLFFTPKSYAEYSNNPRQTGEEVLFEILIGSNKFIVRVGSNGCTDKSSFKIDVKKGEGLSSKAPHYILTIIRIKPDECKAIVFSSSRAQSSDDSLFSIIEKYFTFNFPEVKEVKPEPFDKFVMDHDYFTCYLPANWKRFMQVPYVSGAERGS